ncbi:MAG: hypothetical protein U5L08_09655 [Xanthomonadales bacterium]|nr:hypothetical protein [Xanthomonadales bacterium]
MDILFSNIGHNFADDGFLLSVSAAIRCQNVGVFSKNRVQLITEALQWGRARIPASELPGFAVFAGGQVDGLSGQIRRIGEKDAGRLLIKYQIKPLLGRRYDGLPIAAGQ